MHNQLRMRFTGLDRPIVETSSSAKDLVSLLNRYLREFVFYAGSTGRSESLFYELMGYISVLDLSLIKEHVQMPLAVIDGIERQASGNQVTLGDAAELYLSLISMSESHTHARRKNTINRFRRFAVRSFLPPRLKLASVPFNQKINILDVRTIQRECQCHEISPLWRAMTTTLVIFS